MKKKNTWRTNERIYKHDKNTTDTDTAQRHEVSLAQMSAMSDKMIRISHLKDTTPWHFNEIVKHRSTASKLTALQKSKTPPTPPWHTIAALESAGHLAMGLLTKAM
jgi:hypothetical protein